MADYKRLVSYIYNYDAGMRFKNVGFSRVESKNGKCKVTIHITASISNKENLKVYLFHRENSILQGILFGTMKISGGIGDFKTETLTNSLMGTRFSLDDICGVLIFVNEDKFFGSQWDDQEIQIDRFVEYNKEKESAVKEEVLKPDIHIQPENIMDMVMEQELSNQIKNVSTTEEVEKLCVDQEVEEDEKDKIVAGIEFAQEDKDMVVSEEAVTTEKEESATMPLESLEETVVLKAAQQEPSEQEPPRQETPKQEPQEQELTESIDEQESLHEEIIKPSLKVSKEAEESKQEKKSNLEESVEAKSCKQSCCNKCEEEQYPDCVKNILSHFPKLKPFPTSNSEHWVRIEPKDIGLLPVETWILANNSFLLHGYYNYRHLIFGVLEIEHSMQYVIGVPGLLQSTEQTMAGMFGFHRFLSANEDKNTAGTFGYWIQQIVL